VRAIEIRLEKNIVAVVTTEKSRRVAHGVLVFQAQDAEEQQEVAFLLGRLLDAVPHDLGNGMLVLVQH
jgi:hypothetical protein